MGSKEYAEKVAELTGGTVVDGKDNDKDGDHGVELTVRNGIDVIVWMNEFLKAERSPDWTAGYIQALMKKQEEISFEPEQVMSWEKAKGNLRIMLQHCRRDPQVFRSAKEYGYNDLLLVPYLKVKVGEQDGGTTRVQSAMLDVWNVSPKECIDIAIENSREDWDIRSLNELTAAFGIFPPAELDPDVPEMLVVSNKNRYLGAVAEIFAREELKKRFTAGYTVIPSSRHEVLVLDIRQSGRGFLNWMVNEVNACELDGRDQLSDHVYEIW